MGSISESVRARLPEPIRPVVSFAGFTGWRIASEVLASVATRRFQKSGEVRLDAGTTKNREGRVFIMTDDLRALLEQRQPENEEAERGRADHPVAVLPAGGRGGGPKKPKRISAFTKAWKNACIAASCPGRLPSRPSQDRCSELVRRGVTERVAMKLTGRKTRSVFERYNIVGDGDLDAAAVRLAELAHWQCVGSENVPAWNPRRGGLKLSKAEQGLACHCYHMGRVKTSGTVGVGRIDDGEKCRWHGGAEEESSSCRRRRFTQTRPRHTCPKTAAS